MKKIAAIERYTEGEAAREAGREIAPYGIPLRAWDAAKEEATAVLRERAAARSVIPDSDLVKTIKSVRLDAYDIRLNDVLGEFPWRRRMPDAGC
jgi:hypothetical protein